MATALTAPALPLAEAPARPAPIVLIGNPNVGKSALFAALTGTYATVSNYPGTTVELTEGAVALEGGPVPLVDTPGAASLLPASEDERVTRDLLLDRPPRAAIVVADAKNLQRALVLTLELGELGVPLVLCLNMMDEAEAHGLRLDADALAAELGVPVVPTVAVRRQGLGRLREALAEARVPRTTVGYGPQMEAAIARIGPWLEGAPVAARGLALMVLGGDETLTPWLRAAVPADRRGGLEEAREALWNAEGHAPVVVARARQREAARLVLRARTAAVTAQGHRALARRFETLTIHPLWGWPILLAAVYLM